MNSFNAQKLLDKVTSYDYKLEAAGDILKGTRLSNNATIPAELVEQLKQNKQELISLLTTVRKPFKPTKRSSEAEIERALKRLELGEARWIKIYSHNIGEEIYFVRDKDGIELSEKLVSFTLDELNNLVGCSKEYLKKVYLIKKEFNANMT